MARRTSSRENGLLEIAEHFSHRKLVIDHEDSSAGD